MCQVVLPTCNIKCVITRAVEALVCMKHKTNTPLSGAIAAAEWWLPQEPALPGGPVAI